MWPLSSDGARGPAGRAEAEQLEAVLIDAEPGLTGHLADHRTQSGVVDLDRSAAVGADDVMVMRQLTRDVSVLT